MQEFRLRGPISSPPSSGWRIATVPPEAAALQSAWSTHRSAPTNSKEAWWDMVSFLRANGFTSGKIIGHVKEISIQQWCSPDPSRCRGVKWRESAPYLPWAKAAWENANEMLGNDKAGSPEARLRLIVATLTSRINGPDGCSKCAVHWAQVMAAHPVPSNPSLDEARHWLVDRHNDTRDNGKRVPFAEIADKFNWTTP